MSAYIAFGVVNDKGEMLVVQSKKEDPLASARTLLEYASTIDAMWQILDMEPVHTIVRKGPDAFFNDVWYDHPSPSFLYGLTKNGWYGIFRCEYGRTRIMPLTEFIDVYEQWYGSDSWGGPHEWPAAREIAH